MKEIEYKNEIIYKICYRDEETLYESKLVNYYLSF